MCPHTLNKFKIHSWAQGLMQDILEVLNNYIKRLHFNIFNDNIHPYSNTAGVVRQVIATGLHQLGKSTTYTQPFHFKKVQVGELRILSDRMRRQASLSASNQLRADGVG